MCGVRGDGADRRQWRIKEGEGPPVRGMSRSDKGCAGSGEDGKTTSRQEGIYAVEVCDDCFSGPKAGRIATHYARRTSSRFCLRPHYARMTGSHFSATQKTIQSLRLPFRRYASRTSRAPEGVLVTFGIESNINYKYE